MLASVKVVSLVCFCSGLILVYARPASLGDPCTIPVRKPFYQENVEFYANPSCVNGSTWWSYPAGSIIVNFTPDGGKNFLLCLDLDEISNDITYSDATEGIDNLREIPFPSSGNLVCIPDLNGSVKIQMKGPYFPYIYMSITNYRILRDWTPQ